MTLYNETERGVVVEAALWQAQEAVLRRLLHLMEKAEERWN